MMIGKVEIKIPNKNIQTKNPSLQWMGYFYPALMASKTPTSRLREK